MARPIAPRPRRAGLRAPGPGLLLLVALAAAGCGTTPTVPFVIPPLASLSLSPDTLVVRVGVIGTFTATATDSAGANVPRAPLAWSTDDSAGVILTVNSTGRVTGRGEGSARLFVESGGLRDTALVVVKPARGGWFLQVSNANNVDLNGVFFLADGRTGWAVGNAGRILKTTDAGARWTPKVSNTSFSLNAVWFASPREGWAVGAAGTVLRSRDGGESWSRVDAGAGEALMDVHFAADTVGWAVGSAGVVLRLSVRGDTVVARRTHPTPGTLHGVSFAGTRDGWAVGDRGVIVGTHDGGESWFVVQPAVTSQALRAVWRRSEVLAFAVGTQGVAPRTALQDTVRWQLGNAGAAYQLEGVHFPDDRTGFAVGYLSVGAVLRTNDGGETWVAQVSNTQFRLNDVFFVDAERGWAVGDNGTIIHTGDGGIP